MLRLANLFSDLVTFAVSMRVANIGPNANMTWIVIKKPICLLLYLIVQPENMAVLNCTTIVNT